MAPVSRHRHVNSLFEQFVGRPWGVRPGPPCICAHSTAETRRRTFVGLRAMASAVLAGLLGLAAMAPAQAASSDVEAALGAYEAGRLEEAHRRLEALARSGVPVAQYNLAVMYLRGEVPGGDVARAVPWLERAADAGFVTAMFGLGRMYEEGLAGVRRDLARAHAWYLRAAQAGSVDAQVAAGTAYYLGRGAPHDTREAARWYREAATGGDVGAQYLLASMYEHGEGVAADLRLARYWYDIAARNGDEAAPGKRDEIDRRLRALPS